MANRKSWEEILESTNNYKTFDDLVTEVYGEGYKPRLNTKPMSTADTTVKSGSTTTANTISKKETVEDKTTTPKTVAKKETYDEKKKRLTDEYKSAKRDKWTAALDYVSKLAHGSQEELDTAKKNYSKKKDSQYKAEENLDNLKKKKWEAKQQENVDALESDKELNNLVKQAYGYKKKAEDTAHANATYTGGNPFLIASSGKSQKHQQEYQSKYDELVNKITAKGYDANDLVETYTNQQNQKQVENVNKQSEEIAREHPVISALGSVALTPAQGLSAIQGVANFARSVGNPFTDDDNEYVPTGYMPSVYSSAFAAPTEVKDTVRETQGEDIYNKVADETENDKLAKAARFAYQTGMSMGDSALAATMPGVSGAAMLGGSAFSSALRENKDVSADRGFTTAALQGVNEMLGEAVSLGSFKAFKAAGGSGVGTFFKNVGKQMLVEGSEEVETDLLNSIGDKMINGEHSDLDRQYHELKQQGYSDDEAFAEVANNYKNQLLESFAAGALSGGAFGITGASINQMNQNAAYRNMGAEVKQEGGVQGLIDSGLASERQTKSYKAASALQQQLDEDKYNRNSEEADYSILSNKKLGQLRQYNAEAIANEAQPIEQPEVKEQEVEETEAPETLSVNKVKNGKLYVNTQSGVQNVDNVQFDDAETEKIYKTAATYGDSAKAYVTGYTQSNNQTNAADYATGFAQVYKAQKQGYTFEQAYTQAQKVSNISESQAVLAYGAAEAESAAPNVMYSKVQRDFGKAVNSKVTPGATIVSQNMTPQQQAEVELLGAFAKNNGREVVVIDSFKDIYNEKANGAYVNGKVVLALDNSSGMLAPYFGHEMAHDFKQNASAEYDKLQDYVIQRLQNNASYDFEAQVQKTIEAYGFEGTDEQKRTKAFEEMTANACFTVLSEKENFEQLVKDDRNLAEKVRDYFTKFVNEIRKALEKLTNTAEYRALHDDVEAKEQILKMWNECLEASNKAESKSAEKSKEVSKNAKIESKSQSTPQYSKDVDTAYMQAAENGDEETAQKYVDEAAMKWGAYSVDGKTPLKLYHGTLADSFNEFKKEMVGSRFYFDEKGFFFHSLKSIADDYAHYEFDRNKKGHIINAYVQAKNPFVFDKSYALKNGYGNVFRENDVIGVWDAYQGALLDEIEGKNYDSIVVDEGKYQMVVAFEPNQIKSADPITYDDNGDIIPLDERFTESKDIRFSKDIDENDIDELYNRKIELQRAENEAREAVLKFTNSSEYKALVKRMTSQNDAEFNNAYDEYIRYKNESGYAEAEKKLVDIGAELSRIQKRYTDLSENQAVIDEVAAIKKSGLPTDEYFRKEALKEFGTTPYFYDAGYILPDGKMLNFSGEKGQHYGIRGEDHRAIGVIYANESGTDAMVRFMKDGNIRVLYGSFPGIDVHISNEPTQTQYNVIRDYIESESKTNFNVDFTGKDGNSVGNLRYEGNIDATRIINDIKNYFATGELRKQSQVEAFRYSKDIDAPSESIVDQDEDVFEMNETLRQMIRLVSTENNALREQFGIRDVRTAKDSAVSKLAAEFRKKYGSSYNKSQLVSQLADLYNYITNAGADINSDYIWNTAKDIATNILDKTQYKDTTVYDDYKELRKYIKGTKIFVPDDVRADMTDYNDFRKRNYGKLNLANNGIELDSFYAELAKEYPVFFPADAVKSEQLEALANFFIDTNPIYYSGAEQYAENEGLSMDEYTNIVAADIFDQYFNVPEVKSFVSDKFADEMAALQTDFEQQIADLRESYKNEYESQLEQIQSDNLKRLEQLKQENSKALEKMNEKNLEQLAKQKAHFKEVGKNATERRHASQVRRKIDNLRKQITRKLLNPSDTSYVPTYLVKEMAGVCDTIINAQRQWKNGNLKPEKTILRLDALHRQYQALANDGDYDYSSEYDPEMATKINALANKINGKQVSEMSLKELEDVYNTLRDIKNALVDATQQIGREEKISNYKARKKATQEIADSKGMRNKAVGKYEYYSMNTMRYIRMVTDYNEDAELYKLFVELEQGQNKADKLQADMSKPFLELRNAKNNVKQFDEFAKKKIKTDLIDTNGNPVEMTEAQIVQLIMTARRNQGANHLSEGGFTVYDATELSKGNTMSAKLQKARTVKAASIDQIIKLNNSLSDYAKKWMSAAEHLFNDVSKSAINQTSIVLKHRKIAGVDYYIPITVNPDQRVKELEGIKYDNTLEGAGTLKSVNPNAKQGLIIVGLPQVIDQHISFVSQYAGLAIPIRNINKVYGGVLSQDDPTMVISPGLTKGSQTNTEVKYDDSHEVYSLRNALDSKWQAKTFGYATTIIDNAIRDLQTPRKGESLSEYNALQSVFVQATLAANISVTLKQAASYPTAAAVINGKYLNKALTKKQAWADFKGLCDEIDTYTGLHYKRRLGMSIQEIAEITKRSKAVMNKIPAGINPMKWIQAMDCRTTATLWIAAKLQIEGEHPELAVGTEAYWEAVKNLYEECITKTQPNYDVLHRAEIQKTTAPGKVIFSLFQTQPIQNSGLLYDSFFEMKQRESEYKQNKTEESKAALKKSQKQFANVVQSQVAAQALFVSMTLAAQLIYGTMKRYRDDDDELTEDSIKKRILLDFASAITNVMLPLIGTAVFDGVEKLFEGNKYDMFSHPVVSILNDTVTAVSKIWDNAEQLFYGSMTTKDFTNSSIDSFTALGDLTGIPVSNIAKTVKGIIYHSRDIANGEFGQFKAGSERKGYDELYDIYKEKGKLSAEYKQKEEELTEEKKAEGVAKPNFDSALKSRAYEDYVKINQHGTDEEKQQAKQRCIELFESESALKEKAIKDYAKKRKTGTYRQAEPVRQLCLTLYGNMDAVEAELKKLDE